MLWPHLQSPTHHLAMMLQRRRRRRRLRTPQLRESQINQAVPLVTNSSSASTATASDSSDPEPTTQFLNETEPKDTSAFQAWNDDNFEGKFSPIISDIGATNLDFLANSYIWKPSDTRCCLSFCNGTSYNGDGVPSWICDERYQKNASESFKRIFVWCGEERINENSRCRDG